VPEEHCRADHTCPVRASRAQARALAAELVLDQDWAAQVAELVLDQDLADQVEAPAAGRGAEQARVVARAKTKSMEFWAR
jgi:hypothetical protein